MESTCPSKRNRAVEWVRGRHLTRYTIPLLLLSALPLYAQSSGSDPWDIYGGDYANNLQANNGYGICDFAIDLGTPTANGPYTNAMVYVGTGFPANTAGTTSCGLTGSYCFPAVAIAGQLNSKNVIFVIGGRFYAALGHLFTAVELKFATSDEKVSGLLKTSFFENVLA